MKFGNFEKLIAILYLSVVIYSCHPIRVVSLKTDDEITNKDSISINYSFWQENGCVAFSISNFKSKPIYMDLKKCILFINETSRNYWENKSSIATVASPYINVIGTPLTLSSTTVYTQERILFIAPNSTQTFTFYKLPIFSWTPRGPEIDTILHNRYTATIQNEFYSKELTPLRLRNYLTFSYKENFDNEIVIENNWYAWKITSMSKSDFYGGRSTNDPENSPFKNSHSYYFTFTSPVE